MRQMYEWRYFWTPTFHRASKTTNLLVLFLYIILYPHSLHLMGSLDFISFSVWHSPQIYIIGCCFGGWTSFWASIVSASTAGIFESTSPPEPQETWGCWWHSSAPPPAQNTYCEHFNTKGEEKGKRKRKKKKGERDTQMWIEPMCRESWAVYQGGKAAG